MSDAEKHWLGLESTAEWYDVRPDALMRLVRQGKIPKPDYFLGPRKPRWNKELLDGSVNTRIKSADATIAAEATIAKILKGRRR
jgi:hypothetical protein